MSKFSVKKPFTVLVGIIVAIVLGIVSLMKMQLDLLPEISLPYLMIITTYPGASAEKVETEICVPMEGAMGTINGVKNITSVCNENYGLVQLEFIDGTDLDSAMVKVSSAINTLESVLPDDAGTPSIIELSTDMMASVYLAVSMDGMEIDELSQFIRDDITPYYEKQNGVASVTTLGLVDKTVEVRLNEAKIDKLNDRILASVDDAFASALEQLDDAKQKLEDSEESLRKNKNKLADSQKDLEESKQDLVDGQKELDDSKKDLEKNKWDLANNRADLEKGEQELNDKRSESNEKLADLSYQLDQASASLASLQTQLSQAQTQSTALGSGLKKINNALKQIEEAEAGIPMLEAGVAGLEAQIAATEDEDTKAALQDQLNELNSQLEAARAAVSQKAELEKQKADLETQKKTADATVTALNSAIEQAQGQVENAYKDLEKGKLDAAESIGSADAQLKIGKAQLDSAQTQLDSADDQIESAQKNIDSGWEQISDGQKQINEGWEQITDGQKQIDEGWEDYEDGVKKYEKQLEDARKTANADKLLTLDTLSGLIYAQNFEMPAGYVDDVKDNSWLVKVGQNYEETDELENIVLTNINKVGDVRLGDVADITIIDNSEDSYVRLGREKAVILSIFKSSTAGTNDVSKTIAQASSELYAAHPGITITTLVDMGDYINLIVNSVLKSMLIGAALAIIVLAIFLKDVRPTLVVAISIPISVLAALICMYFSKISLNMLSLSGLALGIGMLVDNSIVVMENIYRLRSRGIAAPRAAVQGTRQVAGAIIASTLTTICVFLPMIYTTGLVNDLLSPMCLTIIFTLLASLFMAMTVVPAASSTFLKKSTEKPHSLFDKIMAYYDIALRFCLKVKIIPIAIALFLLIFSAFMIIRMGIVIIPDMTMTQIQADITYPEEVTRQEAYDMTDTVIDRLLQVEGIGSIGVIAGDDTALMVSEMADQPDNFRQMSIMMMASDPNAGDEEIRSIMNSIEESVADMDVDFNLSTMASEMDQLTGGSGLSINVYGPDTDELTRITRDICDVVGQVKGYKEISNGEEDADKIMHLNIDKNKAMSLGLNVVQIYQDINAKLKHSKSAVTITVDGLDMDIVIVDETDPLTYENILDYEFMVEKTDEDYDTVHEIHKLKEFATVEINDGVTTINRKNQSRYMTVTAQAEDGYNLTLLTRELEPLINEYELPQGYSLEIGGEYDSVISMLKQMALVVVLGLLLVYLIMVAQFQSLLSPFIVIFTVPLAFTGGFLAMWLTGENLSVISILGVVVLMGTVVNNGIVFVDYTNLLRKEGLDRTTALVAAGKTRMRPILMTALTTILAESNLIIGDDMATQLGRGMALVIAGGLAYATLMTLFIIPVMYDIMFKKQPVDIDTGSDTELDDIPNDADEFLKTASNVSIVAAGSDTDTTADTDTDTDTTADTDTDTDTTADTDTDTDTTADTDTDTDTDTTTDTATGTDSNPDSDSAKDPDTDSDSAKDPDTDKDTDKDSDTNPESKQPEE